MSALSRLPKAPATGIVHKWPPIHAMPRSDELAYGQVREALDHVRLFLLAPCADDPRHWSVVVLDDRATEWAWETGNIQPQTAEWLRNLPLVTP